MYLDRIYTYPELFDVKFSPGINYIYGEKRPEGSLNGIGKSLFLDFIDFCLLSHYELTTSNRLRDAYNAGLLTNTLVTLEFTINKLPGRITRTFDNAKVAQFTWDKQTTEYSVNELRNILGDLVFGSSEYPGVFEPDWYRRLISFFVKIQKLSDEKFSNPIKYLRDLKQHEIPVYLFYLLHINNELPYNFSSLVQEKKSINDSIATIKNFISKAYGVKDIVEVKQRIEHIDNQVTEIDQNIKKLYLLRNYDKFEADADTLTSEIKQLYYENASAKKTIFDYNQSLQRDSGFSSKNIESIYKELNEELGVTIKKSLDEAVEFRKQLSSSRENFIKSAIEDLKRLIQQNEKIIEEKEARRRQLLTSLYTKTSFSDLASAYETRSAYQSQRDELVSQTRLLNDLNNEVQNLTVKQQDMFKALPVYLAAIDSDKNEFNNVVNEVLNFIYPEETDGSFSIDEGKKENLIKLKFWEKIKQSHGKNIGRTLVFDFSVLLYNIYKKQNAPRFLIHDGIFDSLDKSHLIKTYEFIQKKLGEDFKFQYITTINEGGFLGKNFESSDVIVPERMKDEAKIVVSPKNKLLKADFYSS